MKYRLKELEWLETDLWELFFNGSYPVDKELLVPDARTLQLLHLQMEETSEIIVERIEWLMAYNSNPGPEAHQHEHGI